MRRCRLGAIVDSQVVRAVITPRPAVSPVHTDGVRCSRKFQTFWRAALNGSRRGAAPRPVCSRAVTLVNRSGRRRCCSKAARRYVALAISAIWPAPAVFLRTSLTNFV